MEPCVGQIWFFLPQSGGAGMGELRTLWVVCTWAIYVPL